MLRSRCCCAAISAGTHFGSLYPGDPASTAVFDFLPDALLKKVENQDYVAGGAASDLWTANTDYRQTVFFRNGGELSYFRALLIDNSHLFGGPGWRFKESSATGKFMSHAVSAGTANDMYIWLQKIEHLGRTNVIEETIRSVPSEWLSRVDLGALAHVSTQLKLRSRKLATAFPDISLRCNR